MGGDRGGREERRQTRPAHGFEVASGWRFTLLLVAIVVLLLTAPLTFRGAFGQFVVLAFADVVLVASLYVARPERRTMAVGLGLAAADLILGRIAVVGGLTGLTLLQSLLWLATLVFVIVTILQTIFTRETVDIDTLQASLCVYLLLGFLWIFAFALVEQGQPGSFRADDGAAIDWADDNHRRESFLRLMVFSFGTLAGTDTGELHAANGFSRIAASLEAMLAQIYLAVVVARLVGTQVESMRDDEAERALEELPIDLPQPGDSPGKSF